MVYTVQVLAPSRPVPPPLLPQSVGVLNYLRSVERTLVINCGGLSLNAEENSQNSTYHSQAHLYHTPADYR